MIFFPIGVEPVNATLSTCHVQLNNSLLQNLILEQYSQRLLEPLLQTNFT